MMNSVSAATVGERKSRDGNGNERRAIEPAVEQLKSDLGATLSEVERRLHCRFPRVQTRIERAVMR